MFGLFVHLDIPPLVNEFESCVMAVEEEEQELGGSAGLYTWEVVSTGRHARGRWWFRITSKCGA